ncbi:STAS domain-containing protein [Amycolatopsis sp. NPDC098790]|uniref:STAS domain-containing protein n=1 Tax=Amycolatopsis sp. NPDC098790 TaxID=3363939 RepID=UPI003808E4E4
MDPAAGDDSPGVPSPRPAVPPVAPGRRMGTALSAPADSTALLAVTGEIDLSTAPGLRVACEAAAAHHRRHLIVDLSEVTFMSSAGINLMVNLRREYTPPQGLHLVLNATVTRLWDLVGITDLFTIHPSRAAALAATTSP